MSILNTLKYYGRGVVLPVHEIRRTVKAVLSDKPIASITDFGSGTLFWSKWFAETFDVSVNACDTIYANEIDRPINTDTRIKLVADISEILEVEEKKKKNALFVCDVIHHLPPDFWRRLMPKIAEQFDIVIIKDIDAAYKFGNFMNRIHDRIINRERIHDVEPNSIEDWLKTSGFSIKREFIPKLWYPHFIITGDK